MTTNYTRLATCASAGENEAIRLRNAGQPMVVLGPSDAWVGPNASLAQKAVYEWAFLAVAYADDAETVAYCRSRIAAHMATENG